MVWDDRQWHLDGLTFNVGDDVDGVGYAVDDESGWSGSPVGADRPRYITLAGWVSAPTRRARLEAEKKLSALCLDPARPERLWELRCTEETGDLVAYVRRADDPVVVIDRGGSGLTFSLLLVAPDPRKYAVQTTRSTLLPQQSGGLDWPGGLTWTSGLQWGTVVSSGSLVLANAGRADAPVTFVLTAAPGETLVNPRVIAPSIDGLLRYGDTLSGGQFVQFDTHPRRRTVLLGGTADRRVRAAGSRWFTIPGRSELLVSFAADSIAAASSLTAIWSPTHW